MQDAAAKTKCLPTYLVFDTSGSMTPHQQLLNQTPEELYASLAQSPRVAEFAHISILSLNEDAEVVVEMTDLGDLQALPQFSCGGRTNYAKVFQLLRQRIDQDVPMLSAKGKAVLRPAVFFMTDGIPTDRGWQGAFETLVSKDWRRYPHVITYGFGEAKQEVLAKVATK